MLKKKGVNNEEIENMHRVSIEAYRVIETRVPRQVFPQLFRVLPNFLDYFYNIDRNTVTENMFSISFRKHREEEKENNLLTLIIKM